MVKQDVVSETRSNKHGKINLNDFRAPAFAGHGDKNFMFNSILPVTKKHQTDFSLTPKHVESKHGCPAGLPASNRLFRQEKHFPKSGF